MARIARTKRRLVGAAASGVILYTIVINLYDPTQTCVPNPEYGLDYGLIGDANLLNADTLVCSRKPSTWTGSLPTVQQKSDVGMKIARGLGGFLTDSLLDWKVDAAIVLGVACPFTGVTCAPALAIGSKAIPDLIFDGAHEAVNQFYDPTTAAKVNAFLDGVNLAVSAATLDPDEGIKSLIDTVNFAEQAEQYVVEVDTNITGEINEVRVVTVGHDTGKTLISVFHRAPTAAISSPSSGTTYTTAQTVTINATASDTVGLSRVELYDGTTLKNSIVYPPYSYSWAITSSDNGSHNWTARAYYAYGQVLTSAVVTLTVNIPALATVATPTITPAGGTFTNSVKVTLSCATAGATIRYTTDGTEPTSSSLPYKKPSYPDHTQSRSKPKPSRRRWPTAAWRPRRSRTSRRRH